VREIPPQPPADLDPLAASVLERLRRHPESRFVVLGGHFALRCYLDYGQLTTSTAGEVVRAGLATVPECWALWQAKNPGTNVDLARGQVVKHLESIGERRPLDKLSERIDRSVYPDLDDPPDELTTAETGPTT